MEGAGTPSPTALAPLRLIGPWLSAGRHECARCLCQAFPGDLELLLVALACSDGEKRRRIATGGIF